MTFGQSMRVQTVLKALMLILSVWLLAGAGKAYAQANPSALTEEVQARLVWTTMVAVDNANRTGNYSVLRDLGSDEFKKNNSTDKLAEIFKPLRDSRIDVGRAVMTTPQYYIPPALSDEGKLRLRGGFEFRPKSLRFDLIFKPENGGWFLDAIFVVEMDSSAPRQ